MNYGCISGPALNGQALDLTRLTHPSTRDCEAEDQHSKTLYGLNVPQSIQHHLSKHYIFTTMETEFGITRKSTGWRSFLEATSTLDKRLLMC